MAEQVASSSQTVVGDSRTQQVAGFRYLYLEEKHVAEWEVGEYLLPLKEKIFGAYRQTFGAAEPPPLLVMFIDLEEKYYDVRAGFAVHPDTPALEGALVMEVPPVLCAGVLVWGADLAASYAPLMDYVNAQGLSCVEGWREWYLYREDDTSPNNVTLVQHVVETAN